MSKQVKLILFSCFYIIGILCFFCQGLILPAVTCLTALYVVNIKKGIFSYKYFAALLTVFLFGFLNTYFNFRTDDDLTPYTGNNVSVSAKVLTIPSNNINGKTKFFAKVTSLSFDDVYLQGLNSKTMVTIQDKQEKLNLIKIGDTLNLNGFLTKPVMAQNPSQFDYSKYLQLKNTFSLLYVKNSNAKTLNTKHSENNWYVSAPAEDFYGILIQKLNDKRNAILNIHRKNIKSPMIEILGGIIFGDDAVNPDEETKDNFIHSGIIHILAASGMNVSLIAGIWFFVSKTLKFNYKFSVISCMLLIIFYTCMTGFGPPIIRGFLMLFLVLLGKLIDRSAPTMGLLFLVAMLMLVYSPMMVFDVGFQLSFIVTFALILSAPVLSFNFKFKPINCIISACLIPVIAQLYAAPLQIFYFNSVTVYSVFANIAIIPVLSVVSFVGFISSIIALVPILSDKICFIADLILNPLLIYIVKTAQFFASLPYSVITIKKPSLLQIILYFAIIILFTCILRYKLFFKKLYYILSLLIIVFGLTFIQIPNNNSEVIFFSVLNADAILIKSPDNKYFILDTGKLPYLSNASQAKYIIIKYLTDKGIKNIDSVILTHFDSDHAGGTLDILNNLNVGKIYITKCSKNTKLVSDITDYIRQHNIKTIIVNREEVIYRKNNFSLTVLKPDDINLKTENEQSLAVKLSYKNNDVLFMGDGNYKTYQALPDDYKQGIEIIKIGHHGANKTIDLNMINNSDLFIISTGKNPYNHPGSDTIALLDNSGKKYLRTDYHNAIKLILDDNKYEYKVFSPITKNFIKI